MRTVTESRLEIIRLAEPNLKVEERDGKRVAVIPKYDFDNDRCYAVELEVIPDPEATGKPNGLRSLFRVRKGNVFKADGDIHTSPQGKPFRIVDFDPDRDGEV